MTKRGEEALEWIDRLGPQILEGLVEDLRTMPPHMITRLAQKAGTLASELEALADARRKEDKKR